MAAKGICSVPECGKNVLGRGYCSTHYSRWRVHGDPLGFDPDRGRHSRSEIAGQRFGKLVAVNRAGSGKQGVLWECRCDCGNISNVLAKKLKFGKTRSCGCNGATHGHARTSGLTPEYRSWLAMRSRCYKVSDAGYHRYGGRGIRVSDRWRDNFQAFLDDMGPRPKGHSLDRIDNNRDYGPSNCRWADKRTQDNNKSTNFVVEFNGVSDTFTNHHRNSGTAIKKNTVYFRLCRGWDLQSALTIKPRSPESRAIDKKLPAARGSKSRC